MTLTPKQKLEIKRVGDAAMAIYEGEARAAYVRYATGAVVEARSFGIEQICRAFGVPPRLVSAGPRWTDAPERA